MFVYLAGPIFGKTDADCMIWRNQANELLAPEGFECIDPMLADYRGMEDRDAELIVAQDKEWIGYADVVLANANAPSWGTAMEIAYANSRRQLVVAFTDAEAVSPWLRCHTNAIFRTLPQAVAFILGRPGEGRR